MSDLQSPPPSVPKYLSEDGITQECEDLILALPSEERWLGSKVYQFQGFWLTAKRLLAYFNCQKHFEAQDSDVILVSSPKSGTTWLKALTFAMINRNQYRNSFHDHPLLKTSPHLLVPFLEILFFDNEAPDLASMPSRRLFAMHFPSALQPDSMKLSSCKIVYLFRNPKDTFVSFWRFTNMLRPKELGDMPIEKFFDMFCRGVTPYGPFWDHALGYWRQSLDNPEKVLFVCYEDMKEQPVEQLKRLAYFLECPFSEEEENDGILEAILNLCNFDNLSNLDVTKTGILPFGIKFDAFYRNGVVGDWRNYLTHEMANRLDKIIEEKFGSSDLKYKV